MNGLELIPSHIQYELPSSGLPVGEAIEAGDKWRLMISGMFFVLRAYRYPN